MIKLTNVSKSIRKNDIVKNINLEIKPGEMTFIVGSSGAGKTTLLNIIGGLIEKYDGRVEYEGVDIKKNLYRYRANCVGYIFQDYNLIEGMTVEDNVKFGANLSTNEFDETEYNKLLSDLKIKSDKQKVETLSGGEKQRTAIIRSIIKKSQILIADEPTGNLDSVNSEEVFTILKNMSKDKYMIIVTHDTEMAKKYGDRIITLSDGEIISDELINKSNKSEVETQINKKTPLKSKINAIMSLGINSIKKRKRKMISVLASLIMTVCAISVITSMRTGGRKIVNGTRISFLDSDLIRISYGYNKEGYFDSFENQKIELSNMKSFKDKYKIKEMVPVYDDILSGMRFEVDDKQADVSYYPINVDSFFEERIMNDGIEGTFPKNDYEIILAKDVSEKLFSGNPIGQKLKLFGNESDEAIELTVAGINKELGTDDKYRTYISTNIFKKIKENDIAFQMDNGRFNLWQVTESKSGTRGYSSGLLGSVKETTGEETLTYGRYIENNNEILISSKLYDEDNKRFMSDMSETQYYLSEINGDDKLYLVGVFESDEAEIRMSKELYNNFKNVSPLVINAYVNDVDNVESTIKKIRENEEIGVGIASIKIKNEVAFMTYNLLRMMRLISVIVVVMSFIMVGSYATITIHERSKEMGIVKSLGADKLTIRFMVMFDIIFMFLVTTFGSYMITNAIYLILSNTALKIKGTYLYCPFYVSLCVSFVLMLIYGIELRLKLRRFIKKEPAELLRG